MRLNLLYGVGEFQREMSKISVPVSEAAHQAMIAVGEKVKTEGRSHIAAAGFSNKWQNALRVIIYDPKKTLRKGELAAAWVYHKIPYAGVFEEGATVRAKMWVPLPWVPKSAGRGRRLTPETFIASANQKLFPIRRNGKTYLAVGLTISGRAAKTGRLGKYSMTALRRGSTGKGENSVRTLVPIFVGVDSVTFKDRLNIRGVVERAANTLGEAFIKYSQGA